MILPESSCKACAKITGQIEGKVLRGFMRDGRTVGGFPTRHGKDRRDSIAIEVKRGEDFENVFVPVTESAGLLSLPKLERAAFLNNGPRTVGVNVIGIQTIVFGKLPEEVARSLQAKSLRYTAKMDAPVFVRMLAKIGYGFAVAVNGPMPLHQVPVLPLIRGEADNGGTWVGQAPSRDGDRTGPETHVIELHEISGNVDGIPEKIVVARINLFANATTLAYEVIVRRTRLQQ